MLRSYLHLSVEGMNRQRPYKMRFFPTLIQTTYRHGLKCDSNLISQLQLQLNGLVAQTGRQEVFSHRSQDHTNNCYGYHSEGFDIADDRCDNDNGPLTDVENRGTQQPPLPPGQLLVN